MNSLFVRPVFPLKNSYPWAKVIPLFDTDWDFNLGNIKMAKARNSKLIMLANGSAVIDMKESFFPQMDREKIFRKMKVSESSAGPQLYEKIQALFPDFPLSYFTTPASLGSALFRKDFVKEPMPPPNYAVRRMALKCPSAPYWKACKIGTFYGKFYYWDAPNYYGQIVDAIGEFPEAKDWRQTDNLKTFLEAKGGIGYDSKRGAYSQFEYSAGLEGREISKPQSLYGFKTGRYFYYRRGSHRLSEFNRAILERVQEKTLRKSLIVSTLGRFYSAKLFPDTLKLIHLCQKYQVPFPLAYQTSFGEFVPYISWVSPVFYPEWWVLIIGKARSVAKKLETLTDPYVVSTDSVITDKNFHSLEMDDIKFELRGTGDTLVVLKDRSYILYDSETRRIVHQALHGLSSEVKSKLLKGITASPLEKRWGALRKETLNG